jgi:uncharacterized protein YdiU (UPF0061 family)
MQRGKVPACQVESRASASHIRGHFEITAYFLSQIVLMKLTQDVTDLHSAPSELHYDSESTYVTLE